MRSSGGGSSNSSRLLQRPVPSLRSYLAGASVGDMRGSFFPAARAALQQASAPSPFPCQLRPSFSFEHWAALTSAPVWPILSFSSGSPFFRFISRRPTMSSVAMQQQPQQQWLQSRMVILQQARPSPPRPSALPSSLPPSPPLPIQHAAALTPSSIRPLFSAAPGARLARCLRHAPPSSTAAVVLCHVLAQLCKVPPPPFPLKASSFSCLLLRVMTAFRPQARASTSGRSSRRRCSGAHAPSSAAPAASPCASQLS